MDKEVSTLLKSADLMESHHPQLVPPGLFHFSSLEEFLPGSLVSHSKSELPSDQLLPAQQVSDNSGDLPTSPASALLLSISIRVGGASMSGAGGSASAGGSGSTCTSALVLTLLVFPLSPFLGVIFVLAILEKKPSQSEARAAL